jgi:hypothetical protein
MAHRLSSIFELSAQVFCDLNRATSWSSRLPNQKQRKEKIHEYYGISDLVALVLSSIQI